MYQFGGIYADVDVKCLRNFESLIQDCDLFLGHENPHLCCNAVLGSMAGSLFYKAAIACLAANLRLKFRDPINRTEWKDGNISQQSGPLYLTHLLNCFLPDIKIFEPDIFYPMMYAEHIPENAEFPNSYTVHYCAASWK